MAVAARNNHDDIQATSGEHVGAPDESPTVPGHVKLDPGATLQAQQQGVDKERATVQQGTEEEEFGGMPNKSETFECKLEKMNA